MTQPEAAQFAIFVPVIMSAGLLVSIVTIVRDALHWSLRHRRRADCTRRAATSAEFVLSGQAVGEVGTGVLRPRWFYLATAVAAGAGAAYIAVGATANYLRPGGYVSDIAWLWALAMLTSVLLLSVAALCLAVVVTWPRIPRVAYPLVLHGALAEHPDAAVRPPTALVATLWVAVGLFVVLTLQVTFSPHLLEGIDGGIRESLEDSGWARSLDVLDPLGATTVAIAVAVLVGLVMRRCPVFALTYVGTVAAGVGATNLLRWQVGRARPDGPLARLDDSFPSPHVVQATLLAGFVVGAVYVWTRRRDITLAVAILGGVVVFLSAIARVATAERWPSDVIGGALLGASLLLVAGWVLGHRSWHAGCPGCPWQAPHVVPGEDRGVFPVSSGVARWTGWAARALGAGAVVVFSVLALEVGLPRNPEGESLGTQVEVPLQVGLLVMVAIGILTSVRWAAVGATLMALGGIGLGMLAAIAHPPTVALLVVACFLLPAIGVWAAWQHDRSMRAVAVLALVATALLTLGWSGAAALHDHFFGPAHPTSPLRAEPVDDVEWIWSGAVTDTSATVVARVKGSVAGADEITLLVTAGGAEQRTTVAAARADGERIVRWELAGLTPSTGYDYRVVIDGDPDDGRGDGSFRTFGSGPQSFTVAFASCARTGSSGVVYDAIRDLQPDLYIADGDIHYGNLSENDVGLFLHYYDRVLTAPSQAALYADVPIAYVWDDHDYGPNDADSRSPSREAARTAYSEAVPHYPQPAGDGGAVYQAFTVGRVRFIMSDTRSERTDTSMLGSTQRAWLERELRRSGPEHALVVWVNPDPWIAPDDPSRDDWGAYAAEREQIADVIAEVGTRNFVMLSGDAHMVALDDGTNSNYSSTGDPDAGFPVLHAAALDRPGNVKGGPYSAGAFPGSGQFGTVTVIDDGGDEVVVELAGHTWEGEILVHRTVTFEVPPTAR